MSEIVSIVSVFVEGFGQGGWGEGGWGGDLYQTITTEDPAAAIDPVALGLSRVAKQFQSSTNFLAYLTVLLEMVASVEDLLQSMYMLPDIDTMTGANLDVIGRIVGVSRSIPNAVQLSFFGFDGYSYETVFGELGQAGIGARFYELDEAYTATTTLGDLEYRLLLRAKIMRNSSHGTCEDILAALCFLFGVSVANVDDNGGMVLGLAVGRQLTATEQAIITNLDILPRPACVLISSVTTFNPSDYFGFTDQSGALGFGDLDVSGIGGVFAELIPGSTSTGTTLVMRTETDFVEAIAA
jgi:hypothetical protein